MKAVLLNLPDAKYVEPIDKMTLREAWDWYIRPAMDRAADLKAAINGESSSAVATKVFEPQTETDALLALSLLGIKVPETSPNG